MKKYVKAFHVHVGRTSVNMKAFSVCVCVHVHKPSVNTQTFRECAQPSVCTQASVNVQALVYVQACPVKMENHRRLRGVDASGKGVQESWRLPADIFLLSLKFYYVPLSAMLKIILKNHT